MIPRIEVLSEQELLEIDRGSRELLQDVGVRVRHEEALKLYQKGGAHVDFGREIVRLPHHLIDEALRKCSPSVRLYGRDGVSPLTIGGMRSYFGTVGFANNVLDRETGLYRPARSEDLVDIFCLADVVEPPHFILTPATPTDVPAEVSDLYEFKIGLTHTRKHIIAQAQGRENLRKIIAWLRRLQGAVKLYKNGLFFPFWYV